MYNIYLHHIHVTIVVIMVATIITIVLDILTPGWYDDKIRNLPLKNPSTYLKTLHPFLPYPSHFLYYKSLAHYIRDNFTSQTRGHIRTHSSRELYKRSKLIIRSSRDITWGGWVFKLMIQKKITQMRESWLNSCYYTSSLMPLHLFIHSPQHHSTLPLRILSLLHPCFKNIQAR